MRILADGKVVIETGLDSSGIEKDISKLGSLASTGLKATTAAITVASGALTAFAGYSVKAGATAEVRLSDQVVQLITFSKADQFQAIDQKLRGRR